MRYDINFTTTRSYWWVQVQLTTITTYHMHHFVYHNSAAILNKTISIFVYVHIIYHHIDWLLAYMYIYMNDLMFFRWSMFYSSLLLLFKLFVNVLNYHISDRLQSQSYDNPGLYLRWYIHVWYICIHRNILILIPFTFPLVIGFDFDFQRALICIMYMYVSIQSSTFFFFFF